MDNLFVSLAFFLLRKQFSISGDEQLALPRKMSAIPNQICHQCPSRRFFVWYTALMEKTYIDKLAYIHLEDGKVLASRSVGKDVWYIPGGKREAGESDEQALIREIQEELSVNLIPATIKEYGVFEAQAHGKPVGTMVRMTCYMADFTGEIQASSEIEEVRFLCYSDKDSTSLVDHLIFDDLKSKDLLA